MGAQSLPCNRLHLRLQCDHSLDAVAATIVNKGYDEANIAPFSAFARPYCSRRLSTKSAQLRLTILYLLLQYNAAPCCRCRLCLACVVSNGDIDVGVSLFPPYVWWPKRSRDTAIEVRIAIAEISNNEPPSASLFQLSSVISVTDPEAALLLPILRSTTATRAASIISKASTRSISTDISRYNAQALPLARLLPVIATSHFVRVRRPCRL
jgi:hypothetical protein